VERVRNLQSLYGYHFGDTRDFIKVYVAMPSLVPGLKRLFDDGISVGSSGYVRGQTFESNVPYVLRFMIDNNISGSDWIELPAGKYSAREEVQRVSRCGIEVDIFFNNLTVYPCTGIWSAIAPLRVLSFDIECQGRKVPSIPI
jgi:DNA polymerase delta subunit 1